MDVVVIIFMVISSIFALATIGYVTVDVIIEMNSKKEPVIEVLPTPEPEPEPEPEVIEEPVEIPIVEHIDANEADLLISDDLAMKKANYESGAGHGKQGVVNIGVIDENFDQNEVVTIAALKAKGLVPKSVGRIKVLAAGVLEKPLTIKAESYSVQAIKMIELTGGTVIILRN